MSEEDTEIVLGEYVGILKTTNEYKTLATGYVEARSKNKVLNKEFFKKLIRNKEVFAGLFFNAPWLWESNQQRLNALQYVNRTVFPTVDIASEFEEYNANLPSTAFGIWVGKFNQRGKTFKTFAKWGKSFSIKFYLTTTTRKDNCKHMMHINHMDIAWICINDQGYVQIRLNGLEMNIDSNNKGKKEVLIFQQPNLEKPDQYLLKGAINAMSKSVKENPSPRDWTNVEFLIVDNFDDSKGILHDVVLTTFVDG